MKRNIKIFASTVLAAFLTACGGGGGSSSTPSTAPATVTGTFVDDPVQGLGYSCSSGATGTTNSNGQYTCNVGDDVSFYIGDLLIGTVAAQSTAITPYTLFPNNIDAAINLARLLQSLDVAEVGLKAWSAPDVIIVIDTSLAALVPADTDFTNASFETYVETALGVELVDTTQAISQLNDSVEEHGGVIPDGGHIPVANAGIDQEVDTGDIVQLDGNSSSDMDFDSLTYLWSFVSKPVDSNATLSDPTSVNPTFIADKYGSYVIQLIINDGTVDSAADIVLINTIYQVTNVSTTSELRAALSNASQNGIHDKIVLADGIYKTTDDGGGTFTFIDNETNILALVGSSNNVVLSGDNTHQIFNHKSTEYAPLQLEKLSFIDAYDLDGYAVYTDYYLDVTDCNFSNNIATGFISYGTTNIKNSTFQNNTGNNAGGFLIFNGNFTDERGYIIRTEATVSDSTFKNNTAQYWGGGFRAEIPTTVSNSTFINNKAKTTGGGFYSMGTGSNSDKTIIDSSTFIGNSLFPDSASRGNDGGAGFYSYNVTVTDSVFFDNNASYYDGGGFKAYYATVTNSNFNNNTARYGGGVFGDFSTITNSIFTDNNCTQNQNSFCGGGIKTGNKAHIANSLLLNNNDGIHMSFSEDNIIVNSIFSNISQNNIDGGSNIIVTLSNNYIDLTNVNVSYFNYDNIFDGINLGFLDEAYNDFHLTLASDLIDAGINSHELIDIPLTDFDDQSRTEATDIGPYEYQP